MTDIKCLKPTLTKIFSEILLSNKEDGVLRELSAKVNAEMEESENLANSRLKKTDRVKKKAFINITYPIKTALEILFAEYLTEINSMDVNLIENLPIYELNKEDKEILEAAHPALRPNIDKQFQLKYGLEKFYSEYESGEIIEFIYIMYVRFNNDVTTSLNLRGYFDEKHMIKSKLEQIFKAKGISIRSLELIYNIWMQFMKCLSNGIVKFNWFKRTSMTREITLGLLNVFGIPDNLLIKIDEKLEEEAKERSEKNAAAKAKKEADKSKKAEEADKAKKTPEETAEEEVVEEEADEEAVDEETADEEDADEEAADEEAVDEETADEEDADEEAADE